MNYAEVLGRQTLLVNTRASIPLAQLHLGMHEQTTYSASHSFEAAPACAKQQALSLATTKLQEQVHEVSGHNRDNNVAHPNTRYYEHILAILEKQIASMPGGDQKTLLAKKEGQITESEETAAEAVEEQEICDKLCELIRTGQRRLVRSAVACLATFLAKGGYVGALNMNRAVSDLVMHFNALAGELSAEAPEGLLVQAQMMQVLSVVSHLLHSDARVHLPFNRRFANNVLIISAQLVGASRAKTHLLRIFSMVLLALVQATPLATERVLALRLKNAIMSLLQLVSPHDPKTFARFYKTLHVLHRVAPVTAQDQKKFELTEILSRFMSKKSVAALSAKLKLSKKAVQEEHKYIVVDPNLSKTVFT